jgi:signal transduction histidine kinase
LIGHYGLSSYNLLSNAVKFTPPGGKIGLDVFEDAAHRLIHFTVWDTGIGIASEDMDRLFEPFEQIDNSLARQYEGTGLGLALANLLAKIQGGRLSVESEGIAGRGSRFTLSLPWPETEADPQALTLTPDIVDEMVQNTTAG